MALIITKTNYWELVEDIIHKHRLVFSSKNEIQQEYCNALENEWEERPFLSSPEVAEYLAEFGVSYQGNYLLESEEWETFGKRQRFATYLNYPLQLSCLALYYPQAVVVLTEAYLFEAKYLLPVLKKRDVYLQVGDYGGLCHSQDVREALKGGAEISVEGKSSKDMTEIEFYDFLYQLHDEAWYLTRELDQKVFPEDFKERFIFEPSEVSLQDYLREKDEKNGEQEYKWLLEGNPGYANTRVRVNGAFSKGGVYRRYPIHYLFLLDGKWKYMENLSVKYPTPAELLVNAVFVDSVFDFEKQCEVSVSEAEEVLALVLDCNEVCDASRYWEYVALVAKYDKKQNVVEICDLNKGILEFHNKLQESEDLHAESGNHEKTDEKTDEEK